MVSLLGSSQIKLCIVGCFTTQKSYANRPWKGESQIKSNGICNGAYLYVMDSIGEVLLGGFILLE